MQEAAAAVAEPHLKVQAVPLVHPAYHPRHTPAERSIDYIVVADSPPIL